MSKKLIARVIMLPDGSVHIALISRITFPGTRKHILALLSNPKEFIKQPPPKGNITAVNPRRVELERIPGLTLIKVFDDVSVDCVFPKVFEALNQQVETGQEGPLNLKAFLQGKEYSDEKHFLMKFYCDFATDPRNDVIIHSSLGLTPEAQTEILWDIFQTAFSSTGPTFQETQDLPESYVLSDAYLAVNPETLLTVDAYAELNDVTPSTVKEWYKKGKLPTAVTINGEIRIPRTQPRPPDGRRNRSMPTKSERGIKKYLSGGKDSYMALQEYLEVETELTENLRRYIRSFDEFKYYRAHGYKEVTLCGQPALIIDVNLDFYSPEHRATNRELITKYGRSPVVPDRPSVAYALHHIGQQPDSPLAIIPEDEHKANHGLFHSKNTASEADDLHGPAFELRKKSFWKAYVELCDRYGTYRNMPYITIKGGYERHRKGHRATAKKDV